MGHDHGSLNHLQHSSPMLRLRLGAVLLLTLAAAAAQLIGALLTGSIALMAESSHMIVDLIGLSIAFGAALMPRSHSPQKRRRIEGISALIQSTLLIGVGVYALLRGIRGLIVPHPLAGEFLLIFAAAGLVANLAAVGILYQSRKANLNFRAAFLEVVSDALGSLAVIAAGAIVLIFGFYQADALAALALAALMIPRGIRILRLALKRLLTRRRWLAIAAALTVSMLVGIGISQLHQRILPEELHLPMPSADEYSWQSEDGSIELSFDGEAGVATLTDSCGSLGSVYAPAYGGVAFEQFINLDPRCEEDAELARFLEVDAAYFGENFESLKLIAGADEELLTLTSEQRILDQQSADSWKPLLQFLFSL